MDSKKNAKDTVLSFIDTLNNMDFKTARDYVSDDISFSSPLGVREGVESYIGDMERLKIKFDVKKVFVDGNDICLLYDFNAGSINLFGCGWYQVENGKIRSLKVVYDPRSILESSKNFNK